MPDVSGVIYATGTCQIGLLASAVVAVVAGGIGELLRFISPRTPRLSGVRQGPVVRGPPGELETTSQLAFNF